MIRRCDGSDFEAIRSIINDGAQTYRGVIPADRWKEPYMSRRELRDETDAGVAFWGLEKHGQLRGVMGIQRVEEVTLIRHAYVLRAYHNQGIGGELLASVAGETDRPILIGTWADAVWAVRFYRKHGFRPVPAKQKDGLLKRYWSVPDRQIETSVVLANPAWFATDKGRGT